jgi:hypothetical protein
MGVLSDGPERRLLERTPSQVKAIRVDGGGEFEAVFEEECCRRGIRLFALPPRSPRLNGAVERAHRTHTEEFYQVTDSTFEVSELREDLLAWEKVYNTIRPHQALGYLTPSQFLKGQGLHSGKEGLCHQCTERVQTLDATLVAIKNGPYQKEFLAWR